MPRAKKDAKVLNIKLDREVYDNLEKFCDETGMNKTVATEKMLTRCLEEYFEKPEEERRLF